MHLHLHLLSFPVILSFSPSLPSPPLQCLTVAPSLVFAVPNSATLHSVIHSPFPSSSLPAFLLVFLIPSQYLSFYPLHLLLPFSHSVPRHLLLLSTSTLTLLLDRMLVACRSVSSPILRLPQSSWPMQKYDHNITSIGIRYVVMKKTTL